MPYQKYFELTVDWFLNLLDRNVIESEIKTEKVKMKKNPYVYQTLKVQL